jgi:crotonobetainyl-CoA:carnitine CoA-transferase CaiB-like acyl-CoA transferase
MSENGGPLAGITVVALEQAVSAPMCTRVLADFGARVIKVENPNGGDFARHYDELQLLMVATEVLRGCQRTRIVRRAARAVVYCRWAVSRSEQTNA